MLISFIGLNGSGKTTQAHMLKDYLDSIGKQAVVLRSVPKDEREHFISLLSGNSPRTNHFYFCAMYSRQVDLIQTHLEKGYVVITDRFWETFATFHREMGFFQEGLFDLYRELEKYIFSVEITYGMYLHIEKDLSTQRIITRNRGDENYESDSSFQVRTQFFARLCESPKWTMIDGTQPKEIIHSQVRNILGS